MLVTNAVINRASLSLPLCFKRICFLRNWHLFDSIKSNSGIQIFQNEKFNFTLHRTGSFSWNWPKNRPGLPVSRIVVLSWNRCLHFNIVDSIWLGIFILILYAMKFASMKLWNALCHVILPIPNVLPLVLEPKRYATKVSYSKCTRYRDVGIKK